MPKKKNDDSSPFSRKFLAACENGQLDKVKSLVAEEFGSIIDPKICSWTAYRHKTTGDTALHLAARQGHLEVVRYLCEEWVLDRDSSLTNVKNNDTKQALHEAAQFAHSQLLHYLLDQSSVQVDALKRADWTPLMLACTQTGPEALECVSLLLQRGANSRLKNKDGWTPLLLACRAGDPEIVQLLIRHSLADCVDDRSNNGRSALHVAAFHAHRDVMDVLLETKRELLEARDSSGCTSLFESVKNRDLEATRYLIEHRGADLQARDNLCQNVLHVAASVGNVPVIEYLVTRCGALCRSKDRFGFTPRELAEKLEQAKAVQALWEYENSSSFPL